MGQRVVRVNELLKREISYALHTRFQEESVAITITDVNVAANLRTATVYYAVLVDTPEQQARIEQFLQKNSPLIRQLVGKVIVLKYLPHLDFQLDTSAARGAWINELMDSMGLEGLPPPQPPPTIEEFKQDE